MRSFVTSNVDNEDIEDDNVDKSFIFLNNILSTDRGPKTNAPTSFIFLNNLLFYRQGTENQCKNISFVDIPEHEATFADVCFCNTDK